MPIVSGYTHMLRAVDNGTRVRIDGDNISTMPISVEVGAPTETWPVGTYIEVVRLPDCAAPVTLVPAIGVTVNFLTTIAGQEIQSLEVGEYARVNLVSPGVWDMHVYKLPPVDGSGFMFQVGAIMNADHYHYAMMSVADAQTLIQTTNPALPVGDVGQPSVVITSADNGNTSTHSHNLTVMFDYTNHKFVVTAISNNPYGGDTTHVAWMVGDTIPKPGTAYDVLTSDGPNAAPSWQTPAGGGGGEPDVCVFKMDAGAGTFGGSLISNWTTVTRIDENPLASWAAVVDPYTSAFSSFATTTAGTYEVIAECMITGNTDAPAYTWPDGLSSYGIDFEVQAPAIAQSPKTKVHTRYSPEQSHPNLPGNFGLGAGASSSEAGLAGSVSTFTERLIVSVPNDGVVIPRMFATSYNSSSATAVCSVTISFRMISNYTAV